jgi:hypothetical protein
MKKINKQTNNHIKKKKNKTPTTWTFSFLLLFFPLEHIIKRPSEENVRTNGNAISLASALKYTDWRKEDENVAAVESPCV